MKFDLTAPCGNCPFRTDITFYLDTERVEEICDSLTSGGTFSCHKTNSFDEDGGGAIETRKTQHCAGALILLEKMEQPNQMMRIGERVEFYDRTKLKMDAPVFGDAESMIEHFAELNGD